jgi:hypothetical protein
MRRFGALLVLAAAVAATAQPARAADPLCTVAMAQMAITEDEGFIADIRATGAVEQDEEVFDVFQIDKLICHDLTGDDSPEMVAFLACCTAASPTPFAIFTPVDGEWTTTYASTRLLVSSEKRKGKTLRLRHPVYKRTDPLCCPSSHTRYEIKYVKGEFRRSRLRK